MKPTNLSDQSRKMRLCHRAQRKGPSDDFARDLPKGAADKLIAEFLTALGSPRAQSVLSLYDSGAFKEIVNLRINPGDYNCPTAFRNDYAATKFLSKCADLKTGIDTRGVAEENARTANGSVSRPIRGFEVYAIIATQ